MAKISWSKALIDYISDETTSYASIAAKYGVSVQAVKKRAGGEKWQALRTNTIQKVDQKLPEKLGEEIAQVNAKHAKIGRMLTKKGIKAINQHKLVPRNFDEAKESIKDGVRIERDALNIQDRSQPPVAIQINFVGVPQEEINKWT